MIAATPPPAISPTPRHMTIALPIEEVNIAAWTAATDHAAELDASTYHTNVVIRDDPHHHRIRVTWTYTDHADTPHELAADFHRTTGSRLT